MPLVDRIVTVDGSAVAEAKNLIVPVGTRVSALLEETGLKTEPGKVLIGGPMLGRAVGTTDDPIVKATSAILAFDEEDAVLPEESPCIRCGRCVSICPASLNPDAIARAMDIEDEDEKAEALTKAGARQCIECACCSYVCPANRPILENNLKAMNFLWAYNKAKQEKEAVQK